MPRYDPLSETERSERMSRIRNKDTKPELFVRGIVYRMGYRYRLHSKSLPGNPDLVFSSRHKVIFVHGCFWHQHGCSNYQMPKTKRAFWEPKLSRNRQRDYQVRRRLRILGWRSLVIWECSLNNTIKLCDRLGKFLGE